jgi:hypothetical protein
MYLGKFELLYYITILFGRYTWFGHVNSAAYMGRLIILKLWSLIRRYQAHAYPSPDSVPQ